jgi:hypothetical protein
MNTAANALTVEHEHTQAVAAPLPASETAAIFQIIERAARDHTVDIDKMKELMAMHKAMRADNAELDFDRSMAAAQEEMQPVRADANNPQTKSKYASYAALDTAIRPIYTKYGFSVSFDTADGAPDSCVRIVAKVAHSGGHRERPHLDMPADGKGAKGGDVMTKTHAVGAAVQYGRRYLLGMIFNLAVSKDDDGNSASAPASGPIDKDQLKSLQDLIQESGAEIELFCERWKIEALPELSQAKFKEAFGSLSRWHEQNRRGQK